MQLAAYRQASPSTRLIQDGDRVCDDTEHVASDLNSMWARGGMDAATAQRAFDQTNAALDKTIVALQSSSDPAAQAEIERLNEAGAYMSGQAQEAGLARVWTKTRQGFLRDLAKDAGKDAIAKEFGEEFGH
jgi:hypothetical protein